jgi:DNA-binding CsgD family transcriptional regulator
MIDNQFSARERDVIALLLQGNSNKEIALALDIANRTVEFHLGNIYAKLGVTSRTEAVIKLSGYHLRESTGKVDTVNQGNPQLKKSDIRGTLTKVFYHTYRSRRRPMKAFVRITILLLLAILITIVILGAFMLIRQSLNPPAISMTSVFLI